MMLRSKLAAFAGALVLAGSAFANQQMTCPSIDSIKSEGLSMAEELLDNLFIAYQVSMFDTDSAWGFILAPVEADSSDVALEESNVILSEMNGQGTPAQEQGMTVCMYETGRQDVYAVAIPADEMPGVSKFKSFVKARG